MAYVEPNFTSKAALKRAVAAGERVTVFDPGGIFGVTVRDGKVSVEGPHYPQPHKWYGTVEVSTDLVVTRVVS